MTYRTNQRANTVFLLICFTRTQVFQYLINTTPISGFAKFTKVHYVAFLPLSLLVTLSTIGSAVQAF